MTVGCGGGRELVELVLGEIGHVEFAGPLDIAPLRRQPAPDQLAEGRFAASVLAQQRDAVVGQDGEIEPLEDGAIAIACRHAFERQEGRGGGPLRARQVEAAHVVFDQHGDRLELGQPLHPRLRLACLRGLGPEAVDEGLQVLALGLLLLGELGQQAALLGELRGEGRIAAAIERELAAIEMQDVIHAGVEQIPIVADHHHRMGVAAEVVVQPQRPLEVEVVGRLVQQEEVGLGEQDRGERHPHAPAT